MRAGIDRVSATAGPRRVWISPPSRHLVADERARRAFRVSSPFPISRIRRRNARRANRVAVVGGSIPSRRPPRKATETDTGGSIATLLTRQKRLDRPDPKKSVSLRLSLRWSRCSPRPPRSARSRRLWASPSIRASRDRAPRARLGPRPSPPAAAPCPGSSRRSSRRRAS